MTKASTAWIQHCTDLLKDLSPEQLPQLGELHSTIEDFVDTHEGKPEAERASEILTQVTAIMLGDDPEAEQSLGRIREIIANWDTVQTTEEGSCDEQSDLTQETKSEIVQGEKGKSLEQQRDASNEDKAIESEEVFLTQDPSFYIDFATEAEEHIETAENILLETGADISNEDINTIFRSFHTIKGVSSFLSLDDLQCLTHRAENVFDKIRSKEMSMSSEIQDFCFQVLDKVKELVENMKEAALQGHSIKRDPHIPAMVEILDGYIAGQQEVQKNVSPSQNDFSEQSSTTKKKKEVNAVKVSTEKLDQVINLVGELVTSQAMINEELQGHQSKSLMGNLTHMKKNVNELQALAMSLRMVPIKGTFMKMSRIIRDLSSKMNKKINFEMQGEDTELDRNMVDLLGDPLVHMVRNSADHGIESEEERIQAGKEPVGNVSLRAFHKGGNIVIQIQDNGKGIDKDIILKKAIEKGLVNPSQELSDNEIFQLIFAPGFSTAQQVTDVSGRGVGMDVVRKNIENLRGRIEIESAKGQGTTFSIHLPLTLAIIDGMVVRVGESRYIIPTISIDQTFGVRDQRIFTVQEDGQMIKFREQMVPILKVEQIFNDPHVKGEGNILMVLGTGERHVAVMVDEIVSQQEVVIKSLHDSMKRIKGLAGSAILPDGTVGLILDPVEIGSLIRA